MARSLEGKTFYRHYNNGVTAIVSEAVHNDSIRKSTIIAGLVPIGQWNEWEAHEAVLGGLAHLGKPIFTFAFGYRVEKSPWFTGDNTKLHTLVDHIKANGGTVINKDFRVPFSNGHEEGYHTQASQRDELRYVTTAQQFVDTFGTLL